MLKFDLQSNALQEDKHKPVGSWEVLTVYWWLYIVYI